jgi:Tfp pilus assembly protein PilF
VEQPDEAANRYRKALEVNTSHIPSLEALGPYYVETEQWEQAQDVLRQLLQLSGGTGDAGARARIYALLGVSQFHLGDLERAKKRLSRALELQPGDVTALKGMAMVFDAQSDWNGLLNVYNNVIFHARDPGDVVRAYLAKGRVLDDHFNLPDKAGQHYVKCLELEADQAYALLGLVELRLRSGAGDDAGGYLERISLEGADARLEGLVALGDAGIKAAAADSDGAQEALSAARAADANLSEALDALGDVTGASVAGLLRTALGST